MSSEQSISDEFKINLSVFTVLFDIYCQSCYTPVFQNRDYKDKIISILQKKIDLIYDKLEIFRRQSLETEIPEYLNNLFVLNSAYARDILSRSGEAINQDDEYIINYGFNRYMFSSFRDLTNEYIIDKYIIIEEDLDFREYLNRILEHVFPSSDLYVLHQPMQIPSIPE